MSNREPESLAPVPYFADNSADGIAALRRERESLKPVVTNPDATPKVRRLARERIAFLDQRLREAEEGQQQTTANARGSQLIRSDRGDSFLLLHDHVERTAHHAANEAEPEFMPVKPYWLD